jgi:hypothetical protein
VPVFRIQELSGLLLERGRLFLGMFSQTVFCTGTFVHIFFMVETLCLDPDLAKAWIRIQQRLDPKAKAGYEFSKVPGS